MIHLSTAAYEVVKGAMLQHYGRMSETADIKSKTDQSNAVVEHIITAYKDKTKANKGKMYTINLYHTQSKILTNGQQPNICIDHIMNIFAEINQDEIEHLNNLIREKCNNTGQQSARPQTTTQSAVALSLMLPSPPGATASIPNSILQESIEDRDPEMDNIITVVCPYCNIQSQDGSIECSKCSQWIHIECEGLSNDDAMEYEEDQNKVFTCNLCQSMNQEQMEPNNSHTKITKASTQSTTTSRVGNSHLQTLQSTPTQIHTQHDQDTTWLKQPATNDTVGNSHWQTPQKSPTQGHTQHDQDTTWLKQPVTTDSVGNSHYHNAKPQSLQMTQLQERANHSLDTTYEKKPATHSTVGNSHLHNSNTHSHHTALSTKHRPDSTRTIAKRTAENSHVLPNSKEALTGQQTRPKTDNTQPKQPTTTAVGNSHSQNTNSSQIVPTKIPHQITNQKQKTPTQTRVRDMLHNTNPKLPSENTSPNNPKTCRQYTNNHSGTNHSNSI